MKPAWEPIILARKPLIGTVAANVLEHGTGALNIDGCRIHSGPSAGGAASGETAMGQGSGWNPHNNRKTAIDRSMAQGRWPANVVLDEEAGALLDEQAGPRGACAPVKGTEPSAAVELGAVTGARKRVPGAFHADKGGASRFFYCAKASKREREAGCAMVRALNGRKRGNHHPTVKPVALMQHLVKLVTPPGGVVIDPFAGSGTTGVAAMQEGMRAVLIEREPEYTEVIEAKLRREMETDR